MADIGNPHGDVYEMKFVVIAETAAGSRFQHCGVFDTSPDRLVARIELAGAINLQLWAETFEIYGSAAWEDADRMREVAWRSDPATKGTIRDY